MQTQREEAALLKRRCLSLGVPASVQEQLGTQAKELLDFIDQAPDLKLCETSGATGLGWVEVTNLRLAANGQILLEHLAETFGLPLPDFNPSAATVIAAHPLGGSNEDSVVEKTMAISLEELKSRAQAAKKRKQSED